MFSRIKKRIEEHGNLKLFGLYLISKDEYETALLSVAKQVKLAAEKSKLGERVLKLEAELEEARDELEMSEDRSDVLLEKFDPFEGDPSPIDSSKRKAYVAQVAGLHNEVLEPKLKHMISNAYSDLEDSSNSREYDLALKGAVYALREMIGWGRSMTNEHMAYVTDDDPSKSEITNNET